MSLTAVIFQGIEASIVKRPFEYGTAQFPAVVKEHDYVHVSPPLKTWRWSNITPVPCHWYRKAGFGGES